MLSLAADPWGGSLDATDQAVIAFSRKIALDAAAVDQDDVEALRAVGLTDNDIADVVFAAATRCFFAKVLDGVGVRADHQLGAAFAPDIVDQLTVGRPIANQPPP